jgi:TetR/AcrR family transcriptional repressor of nem operon
MTDPPAANAREKLLRVGIELFRRRGFVATTVEDLCAEAGVTKGAFFHHFTRKEALAEACLQQWGCQNAAMEAAAPFQAVADPLEKLLGCMDFYIGLFEDPKLVKSCLAGTTVQEVAESNPALREAAQACFAGAHQRFRGLLDDACRGRRPRIDTASLATLWMATLQGSLILGKASRDASVIPESLRHVREYIRTLVTGRASR